MTKDKIKTILNNDGHTPLVRLRSRQANLPLLRGGNKVIAIVGPTASGKTGIGVKLAKEFDGEIVSADSRQVFRRLNLGTGKDLDEFGDIKYHMIDIAEPGQKMTLFDYLPLARAAIDDVLDRGKLPIIVGGTGLYVQGLVEGFQLQQLKVKGEKSKAGTLRSPGTTLENTAGPEDDRLSREELGEKTTGELGEILQELDPEKYATIDQKNRHRLIRAIELAQEGVRPIKIKPDFEVLQIGLDLPRAELHDKIDRRVDERFEAGMLEEVIGLLASGVSAEWLMGLGLEYREITSYILESGIMNHESCKKQAHEKSHNSEFSIHNSEFEQMSQQLKFKTHQFARRQLTWLRRFPEINWLSDYNAMKRFVRIFLEH